MSITFNYDIFAVVCVLVSWAGYAFYAERSNAARVNLVGGMVSQRQEWMRRMLQRENRMVDIQIVNALMRSGRFFASTAILIVAGLPVYIRTYQYSAMRAQPQLFRSGTASIFRSRH